MLKNLTKEQKHTYLEKIKEYINHTSKKYCAPELLQANRYAVNKDPNGDHSLDDTIFSKICVINAIEEREKKMQ